MIHQARLQARLSYRWITCLLLTLNAPLLTAREIRWDGDTDDNWHVGTNWQPYTGCIGACGQLVPGPNDSAILSPTIHGAYAFLSADAAMAELKILNGMDVDSLGFHMNVSGLVRVDGSSSTLRISDAAGNNPELRAGELAIEQGGLLQLLGGPQVEVEGTSSYNFLGTILGNGSVRFRNLSGTLGNLLLNQGSILVRGGDLDLIAENGGTLDLDGPTETGVVDVDDLATINSGNRTLTIDGRLYQDSFNGTLRIGKGDRAHFTQPWMFGTGTGGPARIEMNGRSAVATLSGANVLMVDSQARIDVQTGTARFDTDLEVRAGTLVLGDNTTADFAGDAIFFSTASIVKSPASFHQMIVRGITKIRQPLFDWDGFGQDITSIVGGFLDLSSDQIEAGANVFDGTLHMIADGPKAAVLRVGTPGPWVMNGTMQMDGTTFEAKVVDGSEMWIGDGDGVGVASLRVDGLQSEIASRVNFTRDARVTLNPGSRLTLSGPTRIREGAEFSGTGELRNENVMITAHGATIQSNLVNEGALEMDGTSGNGPLQVLTFTQTANGQWDIHLRGTGDSDAIQSTSFAQLDGLLNVIDAVPQPVRGDTFTILTASAVSGEFSDIAQAGLAPGDFWRVTYDATSVVLKVTASADFNLDGRFDCDDVDALVAEIATGTGNTDYDLTGDGQVDASDLTLWLEDAGAANLASGNSFLPGDASLDGVVDGQDFIAWNDHKFTTTAAWCSGDFNADGVVDGQDFIEWNNHKFMSSDGVNAVPEPGFAVCLAAGIIGLTVGRRRKEGEVCPLFSPG